MNARRKLVPFENVDPDAARRLRTGVSFLVSAKTFAQVADEMAIARQSPSLEAMRFIPPSRLPDEDDDTYPAIDRREPDPWPE